MEIIETTKALHKATERLSEMRENIFVLAENRAQTEYEYRLALSKEITRLRMQNVQATLIPDIARGNVASLKHERDLAQELHRSAMQSIEALRTEIGARTNIARYTSDLDV